MAGAEGDLLRLREVLVDGAVEDHLADRLERYKLLGPDLRRVEDVELEVVFVLLCNGLNGERPLRRCAIVDGLLEVLAMEIWSLMSMHSKSRGGSTHQGPGPQSSVPRPIRTSERRARGSSETLRSGARPPR